MKIETIEKYRCEICKDIYSDKDRALKCESKEPMKIDLKVDDKVTPTSGEGAGKVFTVKIIGICSMEWGDQYWELYWHTPKIWAECDWGTRILLFNNYKKLEENGKSE